VVEADGAGDDLSHAAGVVAPDHAVLAHHALALADRLAVPVLALAAKFVHRIKAQIAALRNLRPQTRRGGFALPGQFGFDFAVPLGRAGLETFRGELAVESYRRFVKTQLDDGEIGARRLEIFAQLRARDRQLGAVEIVEGFAEMDEHQIAFVTEERKESGAAAAFAAMEADKAV